MPGLSGEDVYRELREIDAGVPILLSSGFKQDERVRRLIDSGVDGFIHKPYSFMELVKKVGSLTDK
jgi:DNA-binding response OmpR family regulator